VGVQVQPACSSSSSSSGGGGGRAVIVAVCSMRVSCKASTACV
jgi:hypothetical protein